MIVRAVMNANCGGAAADSMGNPLVHSYNFLFHKKCIHSNASAKFLYHSVVSNVLPFFYNFPSKFAEINKPLFKFMLWYIDTISALNMKSFALNCSVVTSINSAMCDV